MDYEKKYKEAQGWIEKIYPTLQHEQQMEAEAFFPELKESENEKIRQAIHIYLDWLDGRKDCQPKGDYTIKDMLAWLEKQGEQKSILNVPLREVILSIWDLGNEWKELTNGCISTEYGTQLDYIQKHWCESEYYLREKRSEQKPNYTTLVETGNGGINALVTRELPTNGCGDEQNPADKAEPIVVRDFNSVFSREKVKEIDKRIEKSQKLYNAKLRDAMRKVEDFPMTD